ncbi:hypothetical protein CGRA01v4_03646 [Colletotrichum graminicola]|nr:hypothetical protein CGRA01v4_03646 [Colletotrichum graminicola]
MCNELEKKKKKTTHEQEDQFLQRRENPQCASYRNASPPQLLGCLQGLPPSVCEPFAPNFDIVLFVLLVYNPYAHKSRKKKEKKNDQNEKAAQKTAPQSPSKAGAGVTRRKA